MLIPLFAPDAIRLDLTATTADSVLAELVALLCLDDQAASTVQKLLKRREALGSTGVGRGVAIPHTRCPLVSDVRLAFGRLPGGMAWDAIDGKPARFFFLIVAPPPEVSNDYLKVLGRIAQFVKEPDVPDRLAGLDTPEGFIDLLREKGV